MTDGIFEMMEIILVNRVSLTLACVYEWVLAWVVRVIKLIATLSGGARDALKTLKYIKLKAVYYFI